MEKCVDCGKDSYTYVGGVCLCRECYEKRNQNKIIEKSKSLEHPSDLEHWDSGDMSELFWIHLGRYVKEPNAESMKYMVLAWHWACHSSHGLSNSFSHALKWAGIDLLSERRKWKV